MTNYSKQYDVVIIDSGVMHNHPLLKTEKAIDAISFIYKNESDEFIISNDCEDNFGHGTAISTIIRKGLPDSSILMIKLIDDENGIEEDFLINVLKYIEKNINCRVINLSLGITLCENYNLLYQACKNITDKGTIIVSAFDNDGAFSYPAAFDCVIGVTSGYSCNKKYDFEFYNDKIINIGAMGKLQKLAWINPEMLFLGGNSFACAHVTVQVLKFIKSKSMTLQEILYSFKKISISNKTFCKKKFMGKMPHLFKINKAALFPFNKEMHSLIRYFDILDFEIVDVYDSKYSMRVGTNTQKIMDDINVLNKIIKNIDKIDWDSFDTLILGHMDELMHATNLNNLKLNIIKQAKIHNKNVYSFDDLSDIDVSPQKNIYYPTVWNEDLPPNKDFKKLYNLSKPIVGVFGTSSKQGKFTLQLMLRKKLIERGYNVGQIGTEPSALLFGMDQVFPMGYNSSVYVKEYDVVSYLNSITNNICVGDAEIIIVGSQSGTVPYNLCNIEYLTISQYLFLLGTHPDAIILNVNPFDEIDYIQRTIKFIESCIDCCVIAIVVFPMTIENNLFGIYGKKKRISDKEYIDFKSKLESTFQLPIFCLGIENDMDNMTNTIVDFFSNC